ncbi:WD40 repeat domain-containing protein, partial [Rhizocola hellebori]|uniref:WD40 repeat domain-containing protein n=1 Tax=Rhizocola hellebori TaxID=1392758 RepID=UPI0019428836
TCHDRHPLGPQAVPPRGGGAAMTSAPLRAWADRQAATVGRTRSTSSSYVDRDFPVVATHRAAAGAVAWLGPDLIYAAATTTVARLDGASARPRWTTDLKHHLSRIERIEASPELIAVSGVSRDRSGRAAVILGSDKGQETQRIPLTVVSQWRPGHRQLLGVDQPVSPDGYTGSTCLHLVGGATMHRTASAAGRAVFSPDGSLIAAGMPGGVLIWAAPEWDRQEPLSIGSGRLVDGAAFSPDGRYLAAGPARGSRGRIALWEYDPPYWTKSSEFGVAVGLDSGEVVAWSPDSTALAFIGEHGQVEVWDAITTRRIRSIGERRPAHSPPGVWSIRWSPDGLRLAVGATAGRIHLHAVTPPPAPPPRLSPSALPFPAEFLARLAAAAADLGAAVPLNVLTNVLVMLQAPPRDAARGAQQLAELHWPPDAAIGIVALIAAHLSKQDEYRSPPEVPRADLARALVHVLTGWGREPAPGEADPEQLAATLNHVADRYLGLLEVLGPDAVKAEPALPVRLRGLPRLPPLTATHRALLDVRLATDEGGSRAEGSGLGAGRVGLSRRGSFSQLVTHQFALPPRLLRARLAQGELLYWTGRGQPAIDNRPLILVLDNTPAVHGPVGLTLRVIAHLLARQQIQAGRGCGLVPLAPPARAHTLRESADLLSIWTCGTVETPAPANAHREAVALGARLGSAVSGRPRTVLLTHPHLRFPELHDLVTVRVHYPGKPAAAVDRHGFMLPPDPDLATLRDALLGVLTQNP